jgi:hypothetical protein
LSIKNGRGKKPQLAASEKLKNDIETLQKTRDGGRKKNHGIYK